MNLDRNESSELGPGRVGRRKFLDMVFKAMPAAGLTLGTCGLSLGSLSGEEDRKPEPPSEKNNYAMAVDVHKCIGCGRCAYACKKENKVSDDPHTMRTWVERYVIPVEGEAMVDSPNGGIDGFPELPETQN
ncbi:MAG: 4Fe-4S binding protein, partial [Acidobacteriota bacterium]|nr:4Fe-4S binding protein [Acidobacteriota bacterium]